MLCTNQKSLVGYQCVFTQLPINTSVLEYADDQNAKAVVEDENDVFQACHGNSNILSANLSATGMIQNEEKQESIVKMVGVGCREKYRVVQKRKQLPLEEFRVHCRSFGTRLHADHVWQTEVQQRIRAWYTGWGSARPFLVSSATSRFRRIVFESVCCCAMLSELEAPLVNKGLVHKNELCHPEGAEKNGAR